jgi:hypothetical protein
MKVVSLLRYTNVGLQKIHPHKKEKLTSNTQGWKLAGAQLPKAHKNLAGILEIRYQMKKRTNSVNFKVRQEWKRNKRLFFVSTTRDIQ